VLRSRGVLKSPRVRYQSLDASGLSQNRNI
jgi:hypothetical protein